MIRVYTDGSCSNNGFKGAISGIGIFFEQDDPRNVGGRIRGKQTNNTAELSAIIHVFSILEDDIMAQKSIEIYSDSQYAIRCATSYGEKLSKKGWKSKGSKPIPNMELVKTIFNLYNPYSNVSFHHVRAHTNKNDEHSLGNAEADRIANEAVQDKNSSFIEIRQQLQQQPIQIKENKNPKRSLIQTNITDYFNYLN